MYLHTEQRSASVHEFLFERQRPAVLPLLQHLFLEVLNLRVGVVDERRIRRLALNERAGVHVLHERLVRFVACGAGGFQCARRL